MAHDPSQVNHWHELSSLAHYTLGYTLSCPPMPSYTLSYNFTY